MYYSCLYLSPIGEILLSAENDSLVGLDFVGSKFCASVPSVCNSETQAEPSAITETKRWLDIYFGGRQPNFTPKISLRGTPFQRDVWNILLQIPYGKTTTYGDVAKQLAVAYCLKRMSAQAVGQAVGRNPVGIIVPCHRVVGADGSLTGYAGGTDKKAFLLKLEGALR